MCATGADGPTAFLELLHEGNVLEKLAHALYKGARELNPETAGGGVITANSAEARAQSKFTEDMGTLNAAAHTHSARTAL